MTTVVLGIDGLDWNMVARRPELMPHLSSFGETGVLRALRSTFPPDSIPAWTTIFTGKEPAAHGVIGTIDYLGKRPEAVADAAPDVLRGNTFWDALSDEGLRVCVVNPFLAYPAWPVNGVMVSGPVFVDRAEPSTFPAELARDSLPQLGGIVDFPQANTLDAFVASTRAVASEQHQYAMRLAAKTKPDFVFLNLLTLDRIQHFFWRFHDSTDPTFPGETRWRDVITEAYRQADEMVREWDAAYGGRAGGTVIILSDHGHGQRASRMVFVDEILRRGGLLDVGGAFAQVRAAALETTKRVVFGAARRAGAEEQLLAASRRIPGRKKLKDATYAVAADSRVGTARTFGRNSFGGVSVRAADAALVTQVIRTLEAVIAPDGSAAFSWVRRREEMLSGPYLDRFPEVLYELREGFATDFGVYRPRFGIDPLHRRVSGGHRRDGVFAASREVPLVPESAASVASALIAAAVGRP